MTTKPVRLRLSRKKGFNLQALSMATNGLPAVNVARPSKWGNPYRVGEELASIPFVHDDYPARRFLTAEQAVDNFREMLPHRKDLDISKLRGKNLACHCRLCDQHAKTGKPFDVDCPDCDPCHADVELELVNEASQ